MKELLRFCHLERNEDNSWSNKFQEFVGSSNEAK